MDVDSAENTVHSVGDAPVMDISIPACASAAEVSDTAGSPPTQQQQRGQEEEPKDVMTAPEVALAGSVAGDRPAHAVVLPQVVVNNVFKHSSASEFEAYLTKTHALAFRKVRKVPQKNFAFITFDSDADMQACMAKLNGAVFRKDKLHVAVRSHVTENRGGGGSNNNSRDNSRDSNRDRGNKRANESTDNQQQQEEEDAEGNKRARVGDNATSTSTSGDNSSSDSSRLRTGRDVASPWADVPYPTQLQRKCEAMKADCIGRVVKEVLKTYKVQGIDKRRTPAWLLQKNDMFGIKFNDIIYSSEIVGYRNKCEFTFGLSVLDQKPCVGFRVATFQSHGDHGNNNSNSSSNADGASGGSTSTSTSGEQSGMRAEIGSVADCPNVPNAMKRVASAFNEYLLSTPLQCYNMRTHIGVWRSLTLRYSRRTRQMVLMLCVQLEGVDEALWQSELDRLTRALQALRRDAFTDAEGDGSKMITSADDVSVDTTTSTSTTTTTSDGSGDALVTGFCLQVFNGLSVPSSDHPVSTVFGKPYIEEELLDCTFRVSPQAFFQVNAPVAELLFAHAIDMMTAEFGTATSTPATTTTTTTTSASSSGEAVAEGVDVAPAEDSAAATSAATATICLDVCCGTGTIGICVAAEAAIKARAAIKIAAGNLNDAGDSLRSVAVQNAPPVAVIGVDLCAPAIEDAWDNAARNGILPIMERENPTSTSMEVSTSATDASANGGRAFFVAARAEALLEGLLYSGGWRGCNGTVRPSEAGALSAEEQRRLHGQLCRLRAFAGGKRLAAIVDPPREGLHGDCLRAIRNCKRIDRLVYVSCNPTGSFPHDAALLCSPVSKRMHGDPFVVVAATPVDLFPNTPHCEMVVVFERKSIAAAEAEAK